MKIVILAGGGGSRLWPLSREARPKQFSRIVGDKTIFEQTLERFLPDFGPQNIFICLSQGLLEQAKQLAPEISAQNYIIEPEKRDTAPAMGLAAAFFYNICPDEPIAFIPADHYIADKSKFLNIIKQAGEIILKTGKMVDIGVLPSFPSTVLGYTKIGNPVENFNDLEVFEFLGHSEKPSFDRAKEYVESGKYLWHASYYMWTAEKIIEAFRKYSPQHFSLLAGIMAGFRNNDIDAVNKNFVQMEKISFDYAVTEKINPADVLIIKGDFGWNDIGAFDVLYDAFKNLIDENGNIKFSKHIGHDSGNCLIIAPKEKIVATIGLNDCVVIDTDDALLICPKARAQQVKKIVEEMKRLGLENYL